MTLVPCCYWKVLTLYALSKLTPFVNVYFRIVTLEKALAIIYHLLCSYMLHWCGLLVEHTRYVALRAYAQMATVSVRVKSMALIVYNCVFNALPPIDSSLRNKSSEIYRWWKTLSLVLSSSEHGDIGCIAAITINSYVLDSALFVFKTGSVLSFSRHRTDEGDAHTWHQTALNMFC